MNNAQQKRIGHTRAARSLRVLTTWELWAYDVWGNARDGYEVNDRSCIDRAYEMSIPVQTYNAGTPQAFDAAYPTDAQIRKAFGLRAIKLETDGDDITICVNRASDSYPIGEMVCTSHVSLSPIRAKGENPA